MAELADEMAKVAVEEKKSTEQKQSEEANSAMEKLAEVVEESQMDEDKMKKALKDLSEQELANKQAEEKRNKLLAAVKIDKQDVQLIADQMLIDASVAERKLREADGNVMVCLKALLV